MPPLTYGIDRGREGRLRALEDKVARLEGGALLRSRSVLVAHRSTFTGSLPVNKTFTVQNPNSTLLFIWGGTIWNASNISVQVALKLDGTQIDTIGLAATISTGVHMALPPGVATATGLTAASHTAQVALVAGTVDSNDTFHLAILELT
jgi:hypothetical protein